MDQQHKDAFARATGPMVVQMMTDIMALPDQVRRGAVASNSIQTVDGHEWKISVEWGGFTGPGTIRQSGN